jgi:gluconate:H+ symporter, GntP family
MHPILILLVGIAAILGGIIVLRLNAFLALLGAAILVSLLAPGEPAGKIVRVAEAFGRTAGNIGIVIALAAIIGSAMMSSGAADRIVRAFLALFGEKRAATALTASGVVLAIPVFFDTVFYLLVPLARSMYHRTGRHYVKYIMAISAGAVATHTLVPPTPGPLVVSATLGVDLGTMVLMGLATAVPAAAAGLIFAGWVDRRMPVPPQAGLSAAGPEPATDRTTPDLVPSLLPILVPVLFISANTVVATMTANQQADAGTTAGLAAYTAIAGNPNFALLLSAAIALSVYRRQCRPTRTQMATLVETSLMSGGMIILITSAGGALGAMLQAARIGPAIETSFAGQTGSGSFYLILAFAIASLLKIAQGSSTVAMITTAAMLSAMIEAAGALPFHTVYVAMAIASGSLVGSWMNDSGFWIYSKMGGLSEVDSLKSWTPLLAVVGVAAMVTTVLLSLLLPLR